MLQIKVAVELASLKQPFAQALHTAARLGVEAVEIDGRNEVAVADLSRTGVRQVRKMLEDLNLRVAALSYRTRRGYADMNELDRRIDATKKAMKLAYELGTNVVVNHIGRVPGEDDAQALTTLRTALADLGREGQRVGAMLAAETGTESGEELLKLIDSLPPGSIGIDFNPANLIVHGFDPREAATKLGAYVMHVHATDGTRDVAAGRGIEVPLGRGSAEFPELLGALEEHQYRGYLTIRRTESKNPLEEIAAAVKYLRALEPQLRWNGNLEAFMKLTNTKRALMGAAAVFILGAVITYRNAGRAFTERDYMLIGAAVVLVVMNVIGSYYFDRKAAQEGLQEKKKTKKQ